MAAFRRHVFVCVNERLPGDRRGCCAAKGATAVAEALKIKAHERGLKRIVRINQAGCLDQCARGVTIVVYPEAIWYGGVTLADVDEIVEAHLVGGRPVARLVIPPAELTGIDPPAEEER
ncbi:MAG: (2Fe-2S) ferredoxin domain-containing protein [Planctomycetota bacterium]